MVQQTQSTESVPQMSQAIATAPSNGGDANLDSDRSDTSEGARNTSTMTPPLHQILDNNDNYNDKLFGRSEEVDLLHQAYEKCLAEPIEEDLLPDSSQRSHATAASVASKASRRGGRLRRRSSMVIITGASGLGKTALARTLEARVQADDGYFLYGKCNQLQTTPNRVNAATRPYAPFAEAFSRFVNEQLGAEEGEDAETRDRLARAVWEATRDTNVSVLTDTIPALKRVLSQAKQQQSTKNSTPTTTTTTMISSSAMTVGGTGARARTEADIPTNVVFCKFLRAFCSLESPLVLLIDDLQWLDSSSLSLFKALVLEQGKIPGLLVMGTCRGNEVSFQDPLAETLRTLEDKHGVAVLDIKVLPLARDAVQDLIKDYLKGGALSPTNQLSALTDLVVDQTGGIPFCALQYLRNLCETQQLRYDTARRQWSYIPDDDEKDGSSLDQGGEPERRKEQSTCISMEKEAATQCNKFGAMILRENRNNEALRHVMMVAACLGTEFSMAQIEAACGGMQTNLEQMLQMLEAKGMLVRREECNSLWSQGQPKIAFRWCHDRFQSVAFEMIPENTRVEFHVAMGLNLLRNLNPLELQQQPFVAMHQFCWWSSNNNDDGSSTSIPFQSEKERTQLATLCLAAGQQAARSSAFEAAATYLRLGLDVIGAPAQAFAAHYDLSLNLYNAAAEMECCLGNFDKVDKLVAAVWEHAQSFRDTLQAYETQVYSLGSREDLEGAIELGLQALHKLGVKFCRKPGIISVLFTVYRTKQQLAKKSADDIVSMEPLTDWKKAAALRLLHLIIPHAHRREINLSLLMATRGIQITLQHGLSEMACFGFFSFGIALVNPLGLVEEGVRIVEMASAIQEKCDAKAMKCRVQLCLYAYSKNWLLPMQSTIQPLQEAARCGALSGDIEMSCLSLYCANCASFLSGWDALDEIEEELTDLNNHFSVRHQETLLFYLRISQQTVQNLLGKASCRVVLSGDYFDEVKDLQHARAVGNVPGVTLVFLFQCFLAVYFNDSLLAKRASRSLVQSSLQGCNLPLLYQAHFVGGLAEVDGAKMSGKKVRRAGNASLTQLRKFARHSPENVLNKVHLIEAERLAMMGRREKSLEKYQLSIELAKKNNFVHEEALACERAGLSLIGWRESMSGAEFLDRARNLYESWGCTGKVMDLSCQEKAPAR